MRGPLLLQKAIVSKLQGAGILVLDRPAAQRPEALSFVTIGDDQLVSNDNLLGRPSSWGIRRADVFVTIHCWTQRTEGLGTASAGGLAATKALAAQVEDALHGDLDVYPAEDTANAFPRVLTFESARYMRDPDGVTGHGVLTFHMDLQELSS